MGDLYTKAMLTLIAAALVVIAGHMLVSPVDAQRPACGTPGNPCYAVSGEIIAGPGLGTPGMPANHEYRPCIVNAARASAFCRD